MIDGQVDDETTGVAHDHARHIDDDLADLIHHLAAVRIERAAAALRRFGRHRDG